MSKIIERVVAPNFLPGYITFASAGGAVATAFVYDISAVYKSEKKANLGYTVLSFKTGWWVDFKGVSVQQVTAAMGEAAEHQRKASLAQKPRAPEAPCRKEIMKYTNNDQTVQRRDRDYLGRMTPLTADGNDITERVYRRAEARQYQENRENGRQRLRDRIGVIERPPRTLREKCLGVEKEKPPAWDFITELRRARKERERKARVRHY